MPASARVFEVFLAVVAGVEYEIERHREHLGHLPGVGHQSWRAADEADHDGKTRKPDGVG